MSISNEFLIDVLISPLAATVISATALMLSVIVAIKQHSLSKKTLIQGEYQQKEKVVLSTIDLITKGSKYEFDREILEKFWKDTVVGRHLFGKDVANFIERVGSRYALALEDTEKNPDIDSLTVDSAGHWLWHQRAVAHDKFDKYFSNE